MQKFLILLSLVILAACNPEPTEQSAEDVGQSPQAGATIGTPSAGNNNAANSQTQGRDARGGGFGAVDQGEELPEGQVAFNNDTRTQKLIQLISGDWELMTANYKKLSIGNNTLKFFEGTQMVGDERYVVSLDCSKSECLQNGGKPEGWCLATGSECYIVTKINIKALEFRRSSDNESFKYVRSSPVKE